MKIVRCLINDLPTWGVLEGETVYALNGSPFEGGERGDEIGTLDSVALLAPAAPSKVVCIGRNYAEHAAELGNEVPPEPLIFLKPPSSIIGPGATIELTPLSQRVEHEAELVLVIGQRCRHLSEEDAMSVVLGYTCGNDVTARDLQKKDGQWARAKGFDTFCPLGPLIETELDPTAGVAVRARVNGEPRQEGTTTDLVFGIAELVAYCAAFTTLLPGDVILTGTPAGVGPITDGDTVEVEVDGIGTLTNICRAED